MKAENWVKVGIAAVIGRFLGRFIVWIFLVGMIPLLILKDLAESDTPGVGHAIWLMFGVPVLLACVILFILTWCHKHEASGAFAFLALILSGAIAVLAIGSFSKGCASLGQDHVGPLFSETPPYAEEAKRIYMDELATARSLGYTRENDFYLIRYYREHPPQNDHKLREPVRNRLNEYRSKGL